MVHDEAPVAGKGSELPVVLGVDGSSASELATAIAFDEASRRGLELIALHAWCDADVCARIGQVARSAGFVCETWMLFSNRAHQLQPKGSTVE